MSMTGTAPTTSDTCLRSSSWSRRRGPLRFSVTLVVIIRPRGRWDRNLSRKKPGPHHNLSLPFLHKLAVEALQDVEGLLALAAVRDEPLAIVEVLYARQRPARRAEVGQNPWRHPAQRGDAPQHRDLVLVDVALVLLRPP